MLHGVKPTRKRPSWSGGSWPAVIVDQILAWVRSQANSRRSHSVRSTSGGPRWALALVVAGGPRWNWWRFWIGNGGAFAPEYALDCTDFAALGCAAPRNKEKTWRAGSILASANHLESH